MALFKCKMCGGALDISGESVAICAYCGTKQTLPRLDDDRRVNLYDRANHFRRSNEYDKATAIYEQILTEDGTDAEAYWSLVLCRFGIEYVEDPSTHKRVPTVNRAQYTSIFDDPNYKSALQYSDGYQRGVYEEEATAINEIQKSILAISQKEEPFDVFICYKETDNEGKRTKDSVLANDLYHQLTAEGFKVFFARITLEDKLGSAYEPYIFAALNSAKVMVVIGTTPEFFKAVWVRNEWSRYLALIKQGQKKMLIPAYMGMDPYDLPEEFSHLQAQDMSKLGFMQDLIRGIKKIVGGGDKSVGDKAGAANSPSAQVVPLLKRAFLFAEDGDWNNATAYLEKVLDLDPENGYAYLCKLMIDLRIRKQDDLKNCAKPFDKMGNYQKALRFADDKLKAILEGYINHINTRNENANKDGIYTRANSVMAAAADNIHRYETAMKMYRSISGWKDADKKAELCKKAIEDIIAKAEAERLEQERLEEEARQKAKAKKKRNIKIALITIPILCLIAGVVVLIYTVFIPNSKYDDAVALMNEGKYEEAIAAFEALDGHEDSAERITECRYQIAMSLKESGKYTEAVEAFAALGEYKDSKTEIKRCKYSQALDLMNSGEYDKAITAFEALGDYEDSVSKVFDCMYEKALALMNDGKTVEAYEAFSDLGSYKDSAEKAKELYYKYRLETLRATAVGDYLTFGKYEQDNNTSNGKEDIEWLVLDKKDGKLLVISKYALDCKVYNSAYSFITWENSPVRSWLNRDFVNSAFESDDRARIPTVTVSDGSNLYGRDPGNSTQDKVFLLSVAEAKKYFGSDGKRQCKPTKYAIANGTSLYTGGTCVSWLRSPGYSMAHAAFISETGAVNEYGGYVNYAYFAVRPAMWIDFNY